jgi:uncharacterized protein
MKITFDPAKRTRTLQDWAIDFHDAEQVFEGPTYTFEDTRFAYPESRLITVGLLLGRMVIVVWTPRGDDLRHIISMRKANGREQARYLYRLG